jgi:hypothetical protein
MIMKMCCKNEMKDLIELVDNKFGLDNVFVTDFDTQTNKEYLLKQSWFVTFHNNEDELLGLLILEWVDIRTASLHFVLFKRGNILKGWRMFLATYGQHFDELQTYIPIDRPDVLRISKALGFNHNKDERYYYGRLCTQTTTTTTTTPTTTTTSCTGDQ